MSSTITISPYERDVILQAMFCWTDPGGPMPFDTRDEAVESLARLNAAFEVFEQLGWTASEDETFTVTMTDRLAALLRHVADDWRYTLAHARKDREKMARDEPGWRCSNETVEEMLANHDEEVREHEAIVEACAAMLARHDAEAVKA